MGGQGGQSLKVLGLSLSDFGAFSLKIEMGGKPFYGFPALIAHLQRQAGLSTAAHEMRRSSWPLTGFAISLINEISIFRNRLR